MVTLIPLCLLLAVTSLISGCEITVTLKSSNKGTRTASVHGIVYPEDTVVVSCDQRGQLEVNGRALGVSDAWFNKGNFTAGSYVCVCKNRFSETRGEITLIRPPQFSSDERIWTAKEGDKVRIPCQFRNRYDGMTYTIVWKDEEQITISDERFRKDGYDLVIMNVTSKDTLKKYFCEVKISGLSAFFNSPLNSVKLISHIQPTLRIHHGVATCTTQEAQRSADVCITTNHNSGNSHKHCSHGKLVVALIAGMTDVECTTEQRANGSSSVLISRTSKKLATANRTEAVTQGLVIRGKLDQNKENNSVSVEVSFHLTPPTHAQNGNTHHQYYAGTIKWTPDANVSYTIRHNSESSSH